MEHLVLNQRFLYDTERKEESTGPTVFRLACDLESDSPRVWLEKEILQTAAITKYDGTFSIDDDIFVHT